VKSRRCEWCLREIEFNFEDESILPAKAWHEACYGEYKAAEKRALKGEDGVGVPSKGGNPG